jgi:haloacid dehalogenase-like hydrolase
VRWHLWPPLYLGMRVKQASKPGPYGKGQGRFYKATANLALFSGYFEGIMEVENRQGELNAASMICPGMLEVNLTDGTQQGWGRCEGLMRLLVAPHAGMTIEEFEQIVKDWLATAQHPRFNQLYTACIYQPMVELLAYLRANGFKTYIVSGGGIEFMRPWTEKAYGIPPEQVIGSSIKTTFKMPDGNPVLMHLPEIDFIDDRDGKPVGIGKFIGRRPILAFGNSDGDQQMLQWTAAGSGARFMGVVHHTDAEREYTYDRTSEFGRLDKALDEAKARGWTVVSMKDERKTIFPMAAGQ